MRTIMLLLPVLLGACTMAPTLPASDDREMEALLRSGAVDDSLFSSDAEVLSDAAIARILEFQWQPPGHARVAVLAFGARYWFGWSEELTEAANTVQNSLTERLATSAAIQHASYLPSILTPSERTVARLREAAARYQADLLLVYRSQCHSFEKYRIIKSRSRARCTIDALLLDTRTGLVPFSLAESQGFDAVKSDRDLTFRETVLRAQLEATASALDRIARKVVAFVDNSQPPVR